MAILLPRMAIDFQQFQRLALAELPVVNRVARALARTSVDADDLTQETYLKAIRSWSSFELRDAGIRPWLMTILNRTHLNRIRQTTRLAAHIDPADVEGIAADEGSRANGAGEGIDWNQFDGKLLAALSGLPDNLRTTLVLWSLQDLTYQEIADTMGVPIGTVMSRLHRARGVMQRRLSGQESKRPN